jgi:hypothetical protein
MLPTYENTPPKDGVLSVGVLLKKEAAEYLAIKEDDLLAHVRQGRLRPRDPQEEPWKFEVRALDDVAAWYDKFRHSRRRIAARAGILGLVLVAVGVCGSLCWPGVGEFVARLLYCLGTGSLGLALRAHRLEREYLSNPFPDYLVSYPFILLINSFALVWVLSYFETTRCVESFLLAAFPLGVVLALYAHPDHWIIPQWIQQSKASGA